MEYMPCYDLKSSSQYNPSVALGLEICSGQCFCHTKHFLDTSFIFPFHLSLLEAHLPSWSPVQFVLTHQDQIKYSFFPLKGLLGRQMWTVNNWIFSYTRYNNSTNLCDSYFYWPVRNYEIFLCDLHCVRHTPAF